MKVGRNSEIRWEGSNSGLRPEMNSAEDCVCVVCVCAPARSVRFFPCSCIWLLAYVELCFPHCSYATLMFVCVRMYLCVQVCE